MQRMKVYLVLFVLMTLTGVFLYNKIGSENKTPVTPITKTATPTTKDTLIGDITRDCSKKYKKSNIELKISWICQYFRQWSRLLKNNMKDY